MNRTKGFAAFVIGSVGAGMVVAWMLVDVTSWFVLFIVSSTILAWFFRYGRG